MRKLCLALTVTSLLACEPAYYDDDWADDDVSSPSYGGVYGGRPSSGSEGQLSFHNDSDSEITVAAYSPPQGLCLSDSLFDASLLPRRLPYSSALVGAPQVFTVPAYASAYLPTLPSLCGGPAHSYALFAVSGAAAEGAYLMPSPTTVSVSAFGELESYSTLIELERESTCAAPAAATSGRLVLPPARPGVARVTAHRVEGDCTVLSFEGAIDAKICGTVQWPFTDGESVEARLGASEVLLQGDAKLAHYTRIVDASDFALVAANLVVRGGATCGNLADFDGAAAGECAALVRDALLQTSTGRGVAIGTHFEVGELSYFVTDASESLLTSPSCGGSSGTSIDLGLLTVEPSPRNAPVAPADRDAGVSP